jgi:hypothetical protein
MKRLRKPLLRFAAIATGLWAVGLMIARAFEGDSDEESDEFRLFAFFGGRELRSRAAALRTGTAIAALGGIDIDLREATPDSSGASLRLVAFLGGIKLTVPKAWRVEVTEIVSAGGVEVATPDPADLPEDAPRLVVNAVVRAGGLLIEAVG